MILGIDDSQQSPLWYMPYDLATMVTFIQEWDSLLAGEGFVWYPMSQLTMFLLV